MTVGRSDVGLGLTHSQNDYAAAVAKKLWDAGIFSETDVTGDTLKKKILNAEVARWNFILGKSLLSRSRTRADHLQLSARTKSVTSRSTVDLETTKRRGEARPYRWMTS